ncbi:M16 family metallopeptidase [Colwelliaceae bacterium 6471]
MMRIFKTLALVSLIFTSVSSHGAYQLPSYEKLTLDNGLTLFLMEQHEVPLIDISIVTKVGAVNDAAQSGLANITVENLVLGTKSLTKARLDDQLDYIGASLFSSANLEFSQLGASFASKDQHQVLPLLSEMVLSPRFEQAEFDKFKKRYLLQLEQAKESPKSVINQYFNRLVFGENGYGSSVTGDHKSVNNITLSEVKNHHHAWYTPNNSAVVVVGDFDSKQMKSQLNALFGQWQKAPLPQQPTLQLATTPKHSKLLLVNKSDAIETTFLIGGKGIARNNPHSVGISVINTILGARFTSWLNDALRVNAGLTYGARSRFDAYSQAGNFYISTFTKTATTIEAVDLAIATYNKLWEQGIDEQTLASAKAYVKGQFPPKFETSSQLNALLVDMYGYGFDESYINTFEQQVNSLTPERTKALITKYFPKENLQFVLVGKADEIREKVTKYGQVTEVNIQDEQINIY